MDTRTGDVISNEAFEMLNEKEKKHYVLIGRDLSHKEKYDAQIKLYSPCGCGSGKKFKFCCKKKNNFG